MSAYHMPFLNMNHFFLFFVYTSIIQIIKCTRCLHTNLSYASYIDGGKDHSQQIIVWFIPKLKPYVFFISVQSLLRVSKHIYSIRYPEFIQKKINQALKLHYTVVEVLTPVNPNVTNSQWQHTLNYHLKIKTWQHFSLEWNDTEIGYTKIISLIYLKKKTLLDFQNPTII